MLRDELLTAWDEEGELIALAIDGLFCDNAIKELRHHALFGAKWDDHDTVRRRFLNGSDGTLASLKSWKDFIMEAHHGKERQYGGSFPGSANVHVPPDVQADIAACIGPYALQLSKKRGSRILQAHAKGIQDMLEAGGHKGPLPQDLVPISDRAFFGSVCLKPRELKWQQSRPHVDDHTPGIASILTLTRDTAFRGVTSTAIVRHGRTKRSIIRGYEDLQSYLAWTHQHQHPDSGYMNSSWVKGGLHPFGEPLLLLPNKFNRIGLYLRNRLHTGPYFADGRPEHVDRLLDCDPRKGRLTLNMFFSLHVPEPLGCGSFGALGGQLRAGMATLRNPWLSVSACKKCTAIQGCAWCMGQPYGGDCVIDTPNVCRGGLFAKVGDLQYAKLEGGYSSGNTCAMAAEEAICTSLSGSSCEKCTRQGCAWCGGIGKWCRRRDDRISSLCLRPDKRMQGQLSKAIFDPQQCS